MCWFRVWSRDEGCRWHRSVVVTKQLNLASRPHSARSAACKRRCLAAALCGPRSVIVINELMTSGNEFIELLALGTVDLSGWSLSGAVTMVLPTRFLLAGDTLGLAKDPAGILSESCVARDVIQRWFARVWSLRPSDPCDTGPLFSSSRSMEVARGEPKRASPALQEIAQLCRRDRPPAGSRCIATPPCWPPLPLWPGLSPAQPHTRTHALGFVTKCSCFGACVRSLARRCRAQRTMW